MNYTPVQDRVLIEPIQKTESSGGILFAATALPPTIEATVIAVGPGKVNSDGKLIPVDVSAGDKIVYQRGEGHEVTVDGVPYLVIKEENILGKWE